MRALRIIWKRSRACAVFDAPVTPLRILVQRALSFEPWHFAIAGDYIYSRERITDDDAAYKEGRYGGPKEGNGEETPSSATDPVPSQTARIFYLP